MGLVNFGQFEIGAGSEVWQQDSQEIITHIQ